MLALSRKSQFSEAVAERICTHVAEGGSLKAICDEIGISVPLVSYWQGQIPTFAEDYQRARQLRLDGYADALVPIADDDTLKPDDRKVRVDTRKWLLSKLRADLYGDRLDVTSAGKALAPPTHQIDARVQSIVMQATERMRLAQSLDSEAQALLD